MLRNYSQNNSFTAFPKKPLPNPNNPKNHPGNVYSSLFSLKSAAENHVPANWSLVMEGTEVRP